MPLGNWGNTSLGPSRRFLLEGATIRVQQVWVTWIFEAYVPPPRKHIERKSVWRGANRPLQVYAKRGPCKCSVSSGFPIQNWIVQTEFSGTVLSSFDLLVWKTWIIFPNIQRLAWWSQEEGSISSFPKTMNLPRVSNCFAQMMPGDSCKGPQSFCAFFACSASSDSAKASDLHLAWSTPSWFTIRNWYLRAPMCCAKSMADIRS